MKMALIHLALGVFERDLVRHQSAQEREVVFRLDGCRRRLGARQFAGSKFQERVDGIGLEFGLERGHSRAAWSISARRMAMFLRAKATTVAGQLWARARLIWSS